MTNTSASGGPLQPVGQEPISDNDLDIFFQAYVVAVTGLPNQYVRPRWQPDPPNLPAGTQDWVAVGITSTQRDTFGYIRHVEDGDGFGADEVHQHEIMDVLCSFYGPNAMNYSDRLAQGAQVRQNNEVLRTVGMGFVEVTNPTKVPVMLKNKWTNRVDETLRIRREMVRTYPIYHLLGAIGVIITDAGLIRSINSPNKTPS